MIAFENNADRLFTHLYAQFEISASVLDRQKDENVFQQIASRYTYTLKQDLAGVALRLIEETKQSLSNISHIQQILTRRIDIYVNEFNQKTKQL